MALIHAMERLLEQVENMPNMKTVEISLADFKGLVRSHRKMRNTIQSLVFSKRLLLDENFRRLAMEAREQFLQGRKEPPF